MRPRTILNSPSSSSSLDDDSEDEEVEDEPRNTITLVVPRLFRWCCSRRLPLVVAFVRVDTLGDSSEAFEVEAEGGGTGGNNGEVDCSSFFYDFPGICSVVLVSSMVVSFISSGTFSEEAAAAAVYSGKCCCRCCFRIVFLFKLPFGLPI